MRGGRAACVVVAATVALGGCSLVAVRPPPPSPAPGAPLDCTQSRGLPGLDIVGAVAAPVVGISTWALCAFTQSMQSWSSDPKDQGCGAILWATLGVTATYTGSALYGFHETAACRRLAERAEPPEGPPARPLPPHLAPAPPPATLGPGAR